MNKNWLSRCIKVCVLIHWVCSSLLSANELPETLTFSHVRHPVIELQIIPIIEETYAQLGIKVTFVAQPSERNLLMVSKGVLDGDVAYSELLSASYKNLINVEPALMDSQFVLLCHFSKSCSLDVLKDPSVTLALTDSSRKGLVAKFGDTVAATLYSINDLSRIPKMLDGKRLTYAIYVKSKGDFSLNGYTQLKVVPIFSTKTYHLLHNKHRHLIPLVSASLKKVWQNIEPISD